MHLNPPLLSRHGQCPPYGKVSSLRPPWWLRRQLPPEMLPVLEPTTAGVAETGHWNRPPQGLLKLATVGCWNRQMLGARVATAGAVSRRTCEGSICCTGCYNRLQQVCDRHTAKLKQCGKCYGDDFFMLEPMRGGAATSITNWYDRRPRKLQLNQRWGSWGGGHRATAKRCNRLRDSYNR